MDRQWTGLVAGLEWQALQGMAYDSVLITYMNLRCIKEVCSQVHPCNMSDADATTSASCAITRPSRASPSGTSTETQKLPGGFTRRPAKRSLTLPPADRCLSLAKAIRIAPTGIESRADKRRGKRSWWSYVESRTSFGILRHLQTAGTGCCGAAVCCSTLACL